MEDSENAGNSTESPAMRRLPPAGFDDFRAVHLYLDDLIAIEKAFRVGCTGKFTIAADNHEFDHARDLPLLEKDRVQEIKFFCESPYSYFEVRPYLSRFYRSNLDDLSMGGLLAATREIVISRTPRRSPISSDRFRVLLRRSTDPAPPSFYERNALLVAASVGALVGALATGLVTILLVATGILKT